MERSDEFNDTFQNFVSVDKVLNNADHDTCIYYLKLSHSSVEHTFLAKRGVLRMQLAAWLKRHEGRPGVAQSAMSEQLINVAVTGSRKAEAEAYEVK